MDEVVKMLRVVIEQQTILMADNAKIRDDVSGLVKKISKIEKRLDSLEQRMEKLEKRMDSLEDRVDRFELKLGTQFKALERRLTTRIDKIGLAVARLEDDTPIREEFEQLAEKLTNPKTVIVA